MTRDRDHVIIAVADTGVGIPDAIRDKIFEPFFTTRSTSGGSGQGLAISRAIVVDRHGGSLDFETKLGQGTTFFVRLPIEAQATSRVEAA
jgi:signal transduction histidine kinase